MRAFIQRVDHASVSIEGKEKRSIGAGLVILLGIEEVDGQEDVQWLAKKMVNLRIFDDEKGVMNRSLLDEHGEVLLVSQFTLHAKTKKGNRPSYIRAAGPEHAIPLYEAMIYELEALLEKKIQTGEFGAHMQVQLSNNGPVSIWIDTQNKE
jgi:D-tyrosyl-tRNA(Tyr) deacylase